MTEWEAQFTVLWLKVEMRSVEIHPIRPQNIHSAHVPNIPVRVKAGKWKGGGRAKFVSN